VSGKVGQSLVLHVELDDSGTPANRQSVACTTYNSQLQYSGTHTRHLKPNLTRPFPLWTSVVRCGGAYAA
jgi:hypothetical protein